jgi:hypothetical protein
MADVASSRVVTGKPDVRDAVKHLPICAHLGESLDVGEVEKEVDDGGEKARGEMGLNAESAEGLEARRRPRPAAESAERNSEPRRATGHQSFANFCRIRRCALMKSGIRGPAL